MSPAVSYTDVRGSSEEKTITWRNPAKYQDGTEIPGPLRSILHTALYFSFDRVQWTRFATVPGGRESWKGTLPAGAGITTYYAATSRIPDEMPAGIGDGGKAVFHVSLLPTGDTFLGGGNAVNHSDKPWIGVYTWPANAVANRGLLQWAPLEIPPDASIRSAMLWLYYQSEEGDGGDGEYTVSVSEVLGVRPAIAAATWNTHDGVSPWPGGERGAEGNLGPVVSSATIGKRHRWVRWDVTEVIQGWVTSPHKNNGLALDGDAAAGADSNRFFASREHEDPALWPRLEVEYRRTLFPEETGDPPDSRDGRGEGESFPDVGPSAPGIVVSMEPAEDTWIGIAQNSDANFSAHEQIRTYTWPEGRVANRGFIKWDLSGISAGAAVGNATLWLYYVDDEENGGRERHYTPTVSKVTMVNPDLGNVTWNSYDGLAPWPGGSNGGQEILLSAASSATIGMEKRWVSWDVTEMVREWVADPGTNYGMAIDPDTSAGAIGNRYFASREYPDPGLRPRLLITYTDKR